MTKILSEDKALELTEMLLQNDKAIKNELEQKINEDSNNFKTSDTKPTEIGKLGDIVFCSSPIPGGYIGWVYTEYGWLGFGQIENAPEDDTIPENAFLLSDGTPFTLSDGTIFLYTD